MEKRKLSALPRPEATAEMVEMANRLDGMEHIVTAEFHAVGVQMGSKNMEKRTHSQGVYLDSRGQGHHEELFQGLPQRH